MAAMVVDVSGGQKPVMWMFQDHGGWYFMSEAHSQQLEDAYTQDLPGCRIQQPEGCFMWYADCTFADMTQKSWNGMQRKIMRVAVLAAVLAE